MYKGKMYLKVMFLNLLFKAIKADPSQERIKAFIKRLLQVNFNTFPGNCW